MSRGFWVLLRTYCLESTLVGLKYFYLYPDFFSRCFWAFNLISVLVMSYMITSLLYSRFDEMPTRITIENQFEPVFNLPYPTITLCSPNQMTMSSMEYFNRTLVDGNLNMDLKLALPQALGFYELVDGLKDEELRQLQYSLDINRYSIIEVMGKMPLSCTRFLKKCYLEGRPFECMKLFKPIITSHGYCCAFNTRYYFDGKKINMDHGFKNHTVKAIGFHSSLTVVTDYEPADAIVGTILNAGSIRVMLTDWTEFPVDYETFLVDTNGESFIFLRATYTYCSEEVHNLPAVSRSCLFEYEKDHRPFFGNYHNSDCDHMCYVMAIFKSCKCWVFFLPNLRFSNICKLPDIPCIMNVKKNMSYWLATSLCQCPRDCESRKYRAELSVGNFYAMPYLIKSQNPFWGLKFNTSSSIMNFVFSRPVYMKQKQETVMSIISLVSNLGGVFGLFMGFSGISVLEIFFYIYEGISDCVHRQLDLRRNNAVACQ